MSDAMEYAVPQGRYTYKDYKDWPEYPRYQLFNGEAVMMSSPSASHQRLVVELTLQLGTFLRGKPCQLYVSPFDVRLFFEEDDDDDTVVQPDLLVVCDREKIGSNYVKGAPDLVIEILSPSNTHKEMFLKFNYYFNAGVKEYWVIEPESKKVQVHHFENGHCLTDKYSENHTIRSTVLQGFSVELASLWARMDS